VCKRERIRKRERENVKKKRKVKIKVNVLDRGENDKKGIMQFEMRANS